MLCLSTLLSELWRWQPSNWDEILEWMNFIPQNCWVKHIRSLDQKTRGNKTACRKCQLASSSKKSTYIYIYIHLYIYIYKHHITYIYIYTSTQLGKFHMSNQNQSLKENLNLNHDFPKSTLTEIWGPSTYSLLMGHFSEPRFLTTEFYWPVVTKKRGSASSGWWDEHPWNLKLVFFSGERSQWFWNTHWFEGNRGELSVLGDVMMSDTTHLKFDEWILNMILGKGISFQKLLSLLKCSVVVPYKQACFFLNFSPMMAL